MLSLRKLENLLADKNFIIKTLFTASGTLIYVEIFNINNADLFLLYIPSKFEIVIEEEQENTYKVKTLDINEDEMANILRNYDVVSNIDVRESYDEIELEGEKKLEEFEDNLRNNYNHQIFLKELHTQDNENLKDIFCQLARFKFCVKNLKYKLSIIYKNYLCSMKDDSMECYIIKHYPKMDEKKMYITINLETFYANIDNISNDIITIKSNIYRILNKNHIKHTEILNKILEQRAVLSLYSDNIYKKKEEYNIYISEFEKILAKIKSAEKLNIEKTLKIKEKYANTNSLHTDIERSHRLDACSKDLDKINKAKEEVIHNIIDLRIKQEDLTLKIDKILFDNSILLNLIIKNFSELSRMV